LWGEVRGKRGRGENPRWSPRTEAAPPLKRLTHIGCANDDKINEQRKNKGRKECPAVCLEQAF